MGGLLGPAIVIPHCCATQTTLLKLQEALKCFFRTGWFSVIPSTRLISYSTSPEASPVYTYASDTWGEIVHLDSIAGPICLQACGGNTQTELFFGLVFASQ